MSSVVYDESCIPEELKLWSHIEDLVFSVDEQSHAEVLKILDENKDISKETVLSLIINSASERPFHFRVLGNLFEKIWKNNDFHGKTFSFTEFILYLVKRGVLTKKDLQEEMKPDKEIEQYELFFPRDSLAYAVSTNNIELIKKLATDIEFIKEEKVPFIFNDMYEGLHFIDIAAFSGSLDALKFFIELGCEITKETEKCAIRGGHQSIIDLLLEKGREFNDMFRDAVSFHQNHLAKYLCKEKKVEELSMTTAILGWNSLAVGYLMKKGIDLNKSDFMVSFLFSFSNSFSF